MKFFLSHTQQDGEAKTVAGEIYFGMEKLGCPCWSDAKMAKCDEAAIEEGVQNNDCLIAIVTDNGCNPKPVQFQLVARAGTAVLEAESHGIAESGKESEFDYKV